MAEEKDLKQRVLARARERHLEESVVGCILNLIQDEKQKLPDLLKAFDFLQSLEKEDTSAEAAVTVLAEDEDYSQYTEEELRDLQAKLEAFLKGESDGETKETAPAPPDRRPPSDRRSPSISPAPSGRPSPPGTPGPESGTGGINLRLEDYFHG